MHALLANDSAVQYAHAGLMQINLSCMCGAKKACRDTEMCVSVANTRADMTMAIYSY